LKSERAARNFALVSTAATFSAPELLHLSRTNTQLREELHMRRAFVVLLVLAAFTGGITFAAQQSTANPDSKRNTAKPSAPSKEDEIERGQYLVVEVARCPDCHTPRDSEGRLDRSHWLQGAPIWMTSVQTKQPWASHAPALAHFPYSDQQGQDVLERGIGTNGNPILPPMHAYHLRHEDAVAIIAYLRSL
jgi:mono/diheme cytochrome c family protein